MVPKILACPRISLACSGVTPFFLRSSQYISTISSIWSNFLGSITSAPRMLKPHSSDASKMASSSPTRIGCRKLLARRREAASRIRESVPSVNTIFLGFFFRICIICPNPNIAIICYLSYTIILLILYTLFSENARQYAHCAKEKSSI